MSIERPTGSGFKKAVILLLTAIAVLVADQVTKALVVANLAIGANANLVGDLVQIWHAQNRGASFSLFQGWSIVFLAVSVLSIGMVATNVGQPVVRSLRQRLTYVPGLTWNPNPIPTLGLAVHARITPDSVAAYAVGLIWRTASVRANGLRRRWPIEIIARLDTDGDLRRGAFVLGFSLGAQDRLGAVVSTPGDVSRVDGVSVYGLSTRDATARRR